jgi:hypothetical protein
MNTFTHKYSLFNMINQYNKNKPLIEAYLKKHPIEHFDPSNPFPNFPDQTPDDKNVDDADKKILGMTLGIFLVALLINIILFIIALVLLITHWKNLPSWAQVVSLICLLIGMPVITLIIVLVAKK